MRREERERERNYSETATHWQREREKLHWDCYTLAEREREIQMVYLTLVSAHREREREREREKLQWDCYTLAEREREIQMVYLTLVCAHTERERERDDEVHYSHKWNYQFKKTKKNWFCLLIRCLADKHEPWFKSASFTVLLKSCGLRTVSQQCLGFPL